MGERNNHGLFWQLWSLSWYQWRRRGWRLYDIITIMIFITRCLGWKVYDMYHHNNDIHPLVSDTGKYFCYINNRIDSVGVNMMMTTIVMMMTLLAIREKWKWFSTCQAKESKTKSDLFVKVNFDLTIPCWTPDDDDDDDDDGCDEDDTIGYKRKVKVIFYLPGKRKWNWIRFFGQNEFWSYTIPGWTPDDDDDVQAAPEAMMAMMCDIVMMIVMMVVMMMTLLAKWKWFSMISKINMNIPGWAGCTSCSGGTLK